MRGREKGCPCITRHPGNSLWDSHYATEGFSPWSGLWYPKVLKFKNALPFNIIVENTVHYCATSTTWSRVSSYQSNFQAPLTGSPFPSHPSNNVTLNIPAKRLFLRPHADSMPPQKPWTIPQCSSKGEPSTMVRPCCMASCYNGMAVYE